MRVDNLQNSQGRFAPSLFLSERLFQTCAVADVYRCYERTLHTQISGEQTGAGQRSACSHHTSDFVCKCWATI